MGCNLCVSAVILFLLLIFHIALAGASATIASDAFMNPFDGKRTEHLGIDDANEFQW